MHKLLVINRLTAVATVLTFCVVVLGAFVRLSDAGLGCPDWPGCYGSVLVPQGERAVSEANQAFPDRPLEQGKAWKEMIHRYLASLLGLVIIAIAVTAWRARKFGFSTALPYCLVALVIFQGLLGMWTVTLLVTPPIVLLHLVGGFATLALLWWLWLSTRVVDGAPLRHKLGALAKVGLTVLILQILLGGWTSSNYAALSCPDFPTCQTQWWPPMNFAEGFTIWRDLGVDYEGGVLDNPSRVAIHVSHRIGAAVTTIVLLIVGLTVMRSRRESRSAGVAAGVLLGLLLLQLALGVGNVIFHLPLWVATAHNGGAALLVLSLIHILYHSRIESSRSVENRV